MQEMWPHLLPKFFRKIWAKFGLNLNKFEQNLVNLDKLSKIWVKFRKFEQNLGKI